MMRFQVFLSLWSVTSCLCIDKIPEVEVFTEDPGPVRVRVYNGQLGPGRVPIYVEKS